MPTIQEHLRIAKNNETFSEYLISQGTYLEWAATGMFYAAIHYVEAILAKQNKHSGSHRMRDTAIANDPTLSGIYDEYSELKNDSIQARYQGTNFTLADVTSRVRPSIDRVRGHILALLT